MIDRFQLPLAAVAREQCRVPVFIEPEDKRTFRLFDFVERPVRDQLDRVLHDHVRCCADSGIDRHLLAYAVVRRLHILFLTDAASQPQYGLPVVRLEETGLHHYLKIVCVHVPSEVNLRHHGLTVGNRLAFTPVPGLRSDDLYHRRTLHPDDMPLLFEKILRVCLNVFDQAAQREGLERLRFDELVRLPQIRQLVSAVAVDVLIAVLVFEQRRSLQLFDLLLRFHARLEQVFFLRPYRFRCQAFCSHIAHEFDPPLFRFLFLSELDYLW